MSHFQASFTVALTSQFIKLGNVMQMNPTKIKSSRKKFTVR